MSTSPRAPRGQGGSRSRNRPMEGGIRRSLSCRSLYSGSVSKRLACAKAFSRLTAAIRRSTSASNFRRPASSSAQLLTSSGRSAAPASGAVYSEYFRVTYMTPWPFWTCTVRAMASAISAISRRKSINAPLLSSRGVFVSQVSMTFARERRDKPSQTLALRNEETEERRPPPEDNRAVSRLNVETDCRVRRQRAADRNCRDVMEAQEQSIEDLGVVCEQQLEPCQAGIVRPPGRDRAHRSRMSPASSFFAADSRIEGNVPRCSGFRRTAAAGIDPTSSARSSRADSRRVPSTAACPSKPVSGIGSAPNPRRDRVRTRPGSSVRSAAAEVRAGAA